MNLIDKLFQINGENFDAIKFLSPNFNELQAIYEILTSGHRKDSSISRDKLSRFEILNVFKTNIETLLNSWLVPS